MARFLYVVFDPLSNPATGKRFSPSPPCSPRPRRRYSALNQRLAMFSPPLDGGVGKRRVLQGSVTAVTRCINSFRGVVMKKWLSIPEIADEYGLYRQTIWRLVKERKLP